MTKKFHLMRLNERGVLHPVAGIGGYDTIGELEDRIKTANLRDTGNPLVIVQTISTVAIETHINVQDLPAATLKKAGR